MTPVHAVAVVRFTVGDAVRATIRRIYADENVPRYGAKVTLTE